jgi:hypothetical protein
MSMVDTLVVWFVYMIVSDLLLFVVATWDKPERLRGGVLCSMSGYWLAWKYRPGCPEGMVRVWGPYVSHTVSLWPSHNPWPVVRLWRGDTQWPCSFQLVFRSKLRCACEPCSQGHHLYLVD